MKRYISARVKSLMEEDYQIKSDIAWRSDSPEQLSQFAEETDAGIIEKVLENPHTSPETIKAISDNNPTFETNIYMDFRCPVNEEAPLQVNFPMKKLEKAVDKWASRSKYASEYKGCQCRLYSPYVTMDNGDTVHYYDLDIFFKPIYHFWTEEKDKIYREVEDIITKYGGDVSMYSFGYDWDREEYK